MRIEFTKKVLGLRLIGIFYIAFFCFNSSALSGSGLKSEHSDQKFIVQKISIEGLNRTEDSVVLKELGFSVGDSAGAAEFFHGYEELSNIGLFTNVSIDWLDASLGHVQVKVEERWTTIPIAKLASGGGVVLYTLGLYDINWFGKYVELGMQYERLNTTNSLIFWFKKPRIFGTKQELSVRFFHLSRNFRLYDEKSQRSLLIGGYNRLRKQFNVQWKKPIIKNWFLNLEANYNKDAYSKEDVSDEVKELMASKLVPVKRQIVTAGLSIIWDTEKKVDDQPTGNYFKVTGFYAPRFMNEAALVDQLLVENRNYHKLDSTWTLATRLKGAISKATHMEEGFVLGGFSEVRGFFADRFRGDRYGMANVEMRASLMSYGIFNIQANFFTDVAYIRQDQGSIKAGSYGFGLRIRSPKIYRFVGRLDFAQAFWGKVDLPISFGVQQFF